MRALGPFQVHPLNLGGNVFGWTADVSASEAILDAYASAGGNFIDTADVYSAWVPGHEGGESETVIGDWMAARGNRDSLVVASKVGMQLPSHPKGLKAGEIAARVEASLRRLRTDRIDLLYAHADDTETPLEETLGAFDALVKAGKVGAVAGSNYTAERLAEALTVSEQNGFEPYVAYQGPHNLVDRSAFEGPLHDVVTSGGVAFTAYYGLASGFLSGKYRPGADLPSSVRAGGAGRYLDDDGIAALKVLDEVAAGHSASVASVALAWLIAADGVTCAIASASKVEQVADLMAAAELTLTPDELAALDALPAR